MQLEDAILLAIVDKLFIGVLLVIFGLWINEKLERTKGQITLEVEKEKGEIALRVQNAVSPFRGTAYARLWSLTEELSPRGPLELPPDERVMLREALREWYYKSGNAMYLSIDSADLFLKGLTALEPAQQFEPGIAKTIFSALRTQMKVDLGIYTKDDARTQIPRAG